MTVSTQTTKAPCNKSSNGISSSGHSAKLSTEVPIFLRKTYHMIDTCDENIASWADDGSTFVVKQPETFEKEIIPQFFKHNKFSSFVRQLNFYGFRKIKFSDSILIDEDLEKKTANFWKFRHENFKRGREDLLMEIKRSHNTNTGAGVNGNGGGSCSGSGSGSEDQHVAVNHNLKNSFTAVRTTIPAQYQPMPQHESVSGHNNMIFPCFVPASTTSTHYLADEDKDRVNESVSASAAAATGSLENKDDVNLNHNTMNTFTKRCQNKQDMLETSVEKAKDVVRRIMGGTRSDTSSQMVDHHNHHPHHHRLSINDTNLHSYPYAQKRHEFLTQHYQKLHKYYIQNLDYLSKQDDIKLQQQENHLQFVKEKYATATQQQHEQQLIRRKRLYSYMGGIGNVKQKNFQKQLQKDDDDNMIMSSSQSFVSRNGLCCGIYVTGLPLNSKGYSDSDVDVNDDDVQSIKDLLMQLFSSFGKVANVKLYRKKSGELKGDGLVVYDWSHHVRKEWMAKKRKEGQVVEQEKQEEEDKEIKDFLKMVCLQVSV
mmetsp:Transcript_3580/g.6763  ORF Transcript_3580/g.6763 Transcript_3580/m.6763 type:complete len:540 (-) Transcript_3580:770-2389(-)